MANRNYSSGGKMYMMEGKPVKISCNFIVDSTNGNGLGIRSLKGPLVQNVFMHTTVTAGAGNRSPFAPNIPVINPNPAAGYAVIQLQDPYLRLLSGTKSFASPLSGSPLLVASAGLTVGLPYVIVSVGTTTTAAWQALGVPAGVTPAIGVAFVAAATSAAGTGAVEVPATAGTGVFTIETVGDPNTTVNSSGAVNLITAQGFGAQIIIRFMAESGGAPVIGTPADGSVINLDFLMNDLAATQIQGQ